MRLCEVIYKITESFPKQEMYGLSVQMRRASISIPSNIAEGFSRKHGKEFRQFIAIALGSLAELETQTDMAGRLLYISKEDAAGFVEEMNLLGKKMTKFYQMIRF